MHEVSVTMTKDLTCMVQGCNQDELARAKRRIATDAHDSCRVMYALSTNQG